MKKENGLGLAFVIVMFGGLLFWQSSGVSMDNLALPEAPFEEPVKNVTPDVLHNESEWTTNFTHDGAIIKEGDTYYVFSTDYMVGAEPTPGIQIRKSKDLIHWEFAGRVFEQVSEEAFNWTGGTTFWAPSITKIGDRFHLYYSVSGVGSRTSYIGMATADDIEGPWTDEGPVVKSQEGDEGVANAIDSHVLQDADGKWWMTYGSYFGGIFLTEIDPETGKRVDESSEGTLLANRKDMSMGIEGPEILYNDETGYYYLMVSYGWLEDTYNVRIGRSKSIEGPYIDYNNRDLRDESDESFNTGVKIINSYQFEGSDGYVGTGHSAFLQDGDDTYVIHQARPSEDIYWSQLQVRKVYWSEDGWPLVSPERYAGEEDVAVEEAHLIGDWDWLVFPRFDDDQQKSKVLTLQRGGKLKDDEGSWSLDGTTLRIEMEAESFEAKVAPAWDWENWKATLVFTGLSEDGTATWGKKR